MRWLPFVLLAGCGGRDGLYISPIAAQFSVPELVSVPDTAVGDTHSFVINVSSERADGRLVSVDVLSLDDEVFAWTGESFDIESGTSVPVNFSFTPTSESNARAVVTFVLQGDDNEGSVETLVRGRGVGLRVQRWPAVVDYGPVEPGVRRVQEVVVHNDGALPVELADIDLSGTDFALISESNPTVPAGGNVEIEVEFVGQTLDPSDGDVVITLQDGTELAPVLLVANDCEGGSPSLYDDDADGWTSCSGDCDDRRSQTFPGASELPDGLDNDCDGLIDEGTAGYDDDGDGFTEHQGDCNDNAFTINPGRTEVLGDGIDNDCDGVADLGSDDVDSDGYSPDAGDCDDRNAAAHPGAAEVGDGIDNDCDGQIDEHTRWADDDGDGFCETLEAECSDGSEGGDCADGNHALSHLIYPGAEELPDGIDNDCDGEVDEGTVRGDDDGDGYSETAGDCDDANPAVSPGHVERVGNGVDDDCDESTPD